VLQLLKRCFFLSEQIIWLLLKIGLRTYTYIFLIILFKYTLNVQRFFKLHMSCTKLFRLTKKHFKMTFGDFLVQKYVNRTDMTRYYYCRMCLDSLESPFLGPRRFWGLEIFFLTWKVVDITFERPNGRFKNKICLVVEVRLIKGKIDHPTFFFKYGTSAIKT
jgi:hypothetical protein